MSDLPPEHAPRAPRRPLVTLKLPKLSTPEVLAFLTFAMFAWSMWRSSNMKDQAQYGQLIDVLRNVFLLIVGFYFGSSRSSQAKDGVIASMQDKAE